MPFRRRRTRRRRRRTRTTALKAVRRLARFVDTELHQTVFVDIANNIIGGTAEFLPLINVAQGDNDTNRTGIAIALRNYEIRCLVERGNSDNCIRFILLSDRQTNGAQPLIADILEITTGNEETMVSPMENDNKRRFRILRDQTRSVSVGTSETFCFRMAGKVSNKVMFEGVSPNLGDVVSGMLWLVLLSTGAGGAASPSVTTVSRVWFAP